MADDVKINIGADSSRATTEFDKVKRSVDSLKAKTKDGFFDLEGEKRVERNISSLIAGLAKSESAAEALVLTFDRLENVIQSSVAGAAVVAGFGALYSAIRDNEKAAVAFRDALISAKRAFDDAFLGGNLDAQSTAMKKLMADTQTEIERLSSKWTKMKQGLVSGITLGMAGNSRLDQLARAEQAIKELDTMRTDSELAARRDADAKNKAQAEKTADEANAKWVADTLDAINEKNAEEEKKWKEQDEKELKDEKEKLAAENKMKFQAQQDELEWRKQNADEMAEFEKDKAKEVADKKAELAKKQAEDEQKAAAAGAAAMDRHIADLEAKHAAFGAEAQQNAALIQQGFTVPQIRYSEKMQARAVDKAAGIEARAWARDKFKKNIDDLNAEERAMMNERKQAAKGEGDWQQNIKLTKENTKDLLAEFKKFSGQIGVK